MIDLIRSHEEKNVGHRVCYDFRTSEYKCRDCTYSQYSEMSEFEIDRLVDEEHAQIWPDEEWR